MSGRFTRSGVAAVALAIVACQQAPQIGAHVSAPPATGPSIAITAAEIDTARRVVVTFQASRDGRALGLDEARALAPAWTLAALSTDPVNPTALRVWKSLVLTGAETLDALPVAGPGSPAILAPARQPGAEAEGIWVEQGGGTYTYAFKTAIPEGQALSDTLRVGVFLRGVAGSTLTTSTFDFVPDRSARLGRELVVDAACARCHGTVRAHDGSRTGTKICVTCHTYQHADGQTVDPAAPAGATAATDPNPLEFGRLVHRIHRGKNLPTFYVASSALAAPQPPGDGSPSPFLASRNKLPADPALKLPVDPSWVGRRFSVVGELSHERVYAKVVSRSTIDGQQAKAAVEGLTFPRDYRSCDACHTPDAAQVSALDTEISRRTCHGCHPDVWFATETPPDAVHLAHPGGPQADDGACKECHVVATAGKPEVPMKDAHVPPYRHARYSKPVVQIVSVTNLRPGLAPTVTFTVSDRNGQLLDLDSPVPAYDATSPVPRALTRLSISLAGPASPDFRSLGTATMPISEAVPLDIASTEGQFSYTFPETKKIPGGMDGTWLVVIEARRSTATKVYDTAASRFTWPYTGETVTETADNAVAWVDTATGGLGGAPTLRRRIVDLEKCNACHLRLQFHGARNQLEWCIGCHASDKTDWTRRTALTAISRDLEGNTKLSATYDGIEERSVHLKVLVHRLHTGGRSGTAELSALDPFVIYGYSGATFHDAGEFPHFLARCTVCHLEGTYRIESVPTDAAPTIANETATIRHAATTAHGADEQPTPPITAACTSCHATAYALSHAARQTGNGKEACLSCHGKNGAQSVDKVHDLPLPVLSQ
jgi:OmcA/MtrC family decaheme c-type cytochrome